MTKKVQSNSVGFYINQETGNIEYGFIPLYATTFNDNNSDITNQKEYDMVNQADRELELESTKESEHYLELCVKDLLEQNDVKQEPITTHEPVYVVASVEDGEFLYVAEDDGFLYKTSYLSNEEVILFNDVEEVLEFTFVECMTHLTLGESEWNIITLTPAVLFDKSSLNRIIELQDELEALKQEIETLKNRGV